MFHHKSFSQRSFSPLSWLFFGGEIANADTHDGYFHRLWDKIAKREKARRETIEELAEELAEVESEIVQAKAAPIPTRPIVLQSVPTPPIEAQARIIELLIQQAEKLRRYIEDEEEAEILLML